MPRSEKPGRLSPARYSQAGAAVYELLQELDRSDAIWGQREISRGRLGLLRVLATDGPITMSDVGRARGISRQAVQRLAASLEREGLVGAASNPSDRRAPLLELTPAGLAAYAELSAREARRFNEIGEDIPAERIREATQVLRALRIRGAAEAGAGSGRSAPSEGAESSPPARPKPPARQRE